MYAWMYVCKTVTLENPQEHTRTHTHKKKSLRTVKWKGQISVAIIYCKNCYYQWQQGAARVRSYREVWCSVAMQLAALLQWSFKIGKFYLSSNGSNHLSSVRRLSDSKFTSWKCQPRSAVLCSLDGAWFNPYSSVTHRYVSWEVHATAWWHMHMQHWSRMNLLYVQISWIWY